MRKTKENVIKLLEAKMNNAYDMYKMYKKDGDEEEARVYLSDSIAYQDAIWCLTDGKYFNNMIKVFHLDSEDQDVQ